MVDSRLHLELLWSHLLICLEWNDASAWTYLWWKLEEFSLHPNQGKQGVEKILHFHFQPIQLIEKVEQHFSAWDIIDISF